jgi:hypothetical protein
MDNRIADFFDEHSSERFELHDRLLRAIYVRLGGAATFSLNKTVEPRVGYVVAALGKNGLTVVLPFSASVSWRLCS